jgi:hypothetical protein
MVDELRVHKQPFPETVWLIAASEPLLHAFEDACMFATQP